MLKMEISKQDVWTFNLNFLLGFKVSTGITYHHTPWNLIKNLRYQQRNCIITVSNLTNKIYKICLISTEGSPDMHLNFLKCNTLVDISSFFFSVWQEGKFCFTIVDRHQIDNDQNVGGRTGKREEVAGLQWH